MSSKHIRSMLFPGTYVLGESSFYGDDRILSFTVAIPAESDEVTLVRTAELLGPVLQTATSISSFARISIMEDSLSYSTSYFITWDAEDELYILDGSGSDEFSSLLELLKHVPTYM